MIGSKKYYHAKHDSMLLTAQEVANVLGIGVAWVRKNISYSEWHHSNLKYGGTAQAYFWDLLDIEELRDKNPDVLIKKPSGKLWDVKELFDEYEKAKNRCQKKLDTDKKEGKSMKILYWLMGEDKTYVYKGSLKAWHEKIKDMDLLRCWEVDRTNKYNYSKKEVSHE